jgi:hypothetical protein
MLMCLARDLLLLLLCLAPDLLLLPYVAPKQ